MPTESPTISLPVAGQAACGSETSSAGAACGTGPGHVHPADSMSDAAVAIAPRVYLETFGCQMNVLDSQLVTGQLRGLGYRFTDDWRQADVVLYNTCSVREQAENKVWSRIGQVGRHKKENPGVVLGVIGCMAERDGLDMVRRYPQVDLLCGPAELDKVPLLIDNVRRTQIDARGGRQAAQVALAGSRSRRSGTLAAAEDQLELIDLSRSFQPEDTSEHANRSAYVRITRGCNKLCTYCVVPHTRGAEVHRPPEHILEECRKLVDQGVIEITLLGQTVNHYHFDSAAAVVIGGVTQPQVGTVIAPNRGTGGPSPVFNATTTSFAELLHRIHEEVPGLQRLRFVTNYPRDFGNDILQVIRESPRICRYLHLPVQSGSNRMLKAMNRGYRVEEYRELIERVRDYLPDAELATDIICGFPTETDEDHQATAELLRWARYKNSFIFKYSPRPGTIAIQRFEDDIPDEIKRQRNNELLAIQAEVSQSIHQAYVGRRVRVFVEQVSAKAQKAANAADPKISLGWSREQEVTQLSGRTDGDLIVMFDGEPSLIGQIIEVDIQRAAPLALFGAVARQPVGVNA